MATHWGATLGLGTGLVLTLKRTYDAYKAGWDVADTFQSCFTSYSYQHKDWDISRAVFTVPAAVGGTATFVAVKTGYNSWTPKGVNI